MIPKASEPLRGANDDRFPKICTGGVDEDSNGYYIRLGKLGSYPILSSAQDVAGRCQHPIQKSEFVEVVDFSRG